MDDLQAKRLLCTEAASHAEKPYKIADCHQSFDYPKPFDISADHLHPGLLQNDIDRRVDNLSNN